MQLLGWTRLETAGAVNVEGIYTNDKRKRAAIFLAARPVPALSYFELNCMAFYFFITSMNLWSIAATCALVPVPLGSMTVWPFALMLVPLIMPSLFNV